MIGLLQRVTSSAVVVADQEIARIGRGLMVLVAVELGDTEKTAAALLRKIAKYRVFPDANDKMNLSVIDAGCDLLLVPQFTLAANTRSGLRPSFSNAASPEDGARLFATLISIADELDCVVASGQFGANMQVSLVNDGPVTFWLQETN